VDAPSIAEASLGSLGISLKYCAAIHALEGMVSIERANTKPRSVSRRLYLNIKTYIGIDNNEEGNIKPTLK